MGQNPHEEFFRVDPNVSFWPLFKSPIWAVTLKYDCTVIFFMGCLSHSFIFDFLSKFFPNILWAKYPMEIFSAWHRILRSPLKWNLWKVTKMRHFGLPWKVFYGAFVPHIFPDMNLGSHRGIMGQKRNEKFFTRFFQQKRSCSLIPMTPCLSQCTMRRPMSIDISEVFKCKQSFHAHFK